MICFIKMRCQVLWSYQNYIWFLWAQHGPHEILNSNNAYMVVQTRWLYSYWPLLWKNLMARTGFNHKLCCVCWDMKKHVASLSLYPPIIASLASQDPQTSGIHFNILCNIQWQVFNPDINKVYYTHVLFLLLLKFLRYNSHLTHQCRIGIIVPIQLWFIFIYKVQLLQKANTDLVNP